MLNRTHRTRHTMRKVFFLSLKRLSHPNISAYAVLWGSATACKHTMWVTDYAERTLHTETQQENDPLRKDRHQHVTCQIQSCRQSRSRIESHHHQLLTSQQRYAHGDGDRIGIAADIWSIGVTFYELIFGRLCKPTRDSYARRLMEALKVSGLMDEQVRVPCRCSVAIPPDSSA